MLETIILDLGSGTTVKNDPNIIKESIDQIYLLQHQSRKKIIIKFQLFEKIKNLIPLDKKLFCFAYYYAQTLDLLVMASVFDANSLKYLTQYKTPYVKIACRDYLYDMIVQIPKDMPVIISVDSVEQREILKRRYPFHNLIFLYCVVSYPAKEDEYRSLFYSNLSVGISDHCKNLNLYNRYHPQYYERHFILEHGITSDVYGDSFCSTAKEIKEIL